MRGSERRILLRWSLIAAAFLVYGAVGYTLFGYGLVESIHNTLLVLTTVGFSPPGSHVQSLGEKAFTTSIAAIGVGTFLVGAALFATALVDGRVGIASRRRRMDRTIKSLSGHFIICAYGRVGRAVARELEGEGVPFVVIDRLEELEERMRADGVAYLIGDPTSEKVLRHVGIERARGLISAVDSDADNVYIVLTARSLYPDVFIVARASESAAADRLYRAGANRVISPYVSSGRHMAMLALRPRVVDYLEIAEETLRLEELMVEPGSPLIGQPLSQVGGRATPLAVRRADGAVVANPAGSLVVAQGDLIVLLGAPTALKTAEGDGTAMRKSRARK